MRTLLAALLLLPASAGAFELKYKIASDVKELNAKAIAIIPKIEAATGLNFSGKCANWVPVAPPQIGYECASWLPRHGRWNAIEDVNIVIEVFEVADPKDARVEPSVLSAVEKAALKAKIDAVVAGG